MMETVQPRETLQTEQNIYWEINSYNCMEQILEFRLYM